MDLGFQLLVLIFSFSFAYVNVDAFREIQWLNLDVVSTQKAPVGYQTFGYRAEKILTTSKSKEPHERLVFDLTPTPFAPFKGRPHF